MQSSAQIDAPRLGDVSGTFSNDSSAHVQSSREISIVSSTNQTQYTGNMYSTVSTKNDQTRPHTTGSPEIAASQAGLPAQSERWSMGNFPSGLSMQRIEALDVQENNRESMKALSDFFSNSQPPPSNWMSIPSDDEAIVDSSKKLAHKLFGKQKKKRPHPPKLMRLPDSAVAAKTRSGARHIAISIPIEHDHVEFPRVQDPGPRRSSLVTRLSRLEAAVTVLKPVVELRKSVPRYAPAVSDDEETPERTLAVSRRPPEIVGPFATEKNTEAFHSQQRRPGPEVNSIRDNRQSCNAYPPVVVHRKNSQTSDPRHSGGTASNTTTLAEGHGYSHKTSTISSVSRSLAAPNGDPLPPRTASATRSPASIEEELDRASNTTYENQTNQIRIAGSKVGIESLNSEPTGSHSPSSPIYVAETARAPPRAGGTKVVKTTTPSTPGAEKGVTQKYDFMLRPVTAPSFGSRSHLMAQIEANNRRTYSPKFKQPPTEAARPVSRQSQQERVRARQECDVETLDSVSISSRSGSSDSPAESIIAPSVVDTTPTRHSKRQRDSGNSSTTLKESPPLVTNSITPILLVANIPPCSFRLSPLSRGRQQDDSLLRDSLSEPVSSNRDSLLSIPDTTSHRSAGRRAPSQSLRSSLLETRRQERRSKRNLGLRERELDARISKIEQDNSMLLTTLSGIAKSFGSLEQVLPRQGSTANLNDSREDREGDFQKMVVVPVVRELQVHGAGVNGEKSPMTGVSFASDRVLWD